MRNYKIEVNIAVNAVSGDDAREMVRKMLIKNLVDHFTTYPSSGPSSIVDFAIWHCVEEGGE